MAKKKKSAGNPARGFATTSIASKPKIDKSNTADATAGESTPAPAKESATALKYEFEPATQPYSAADTVKQELLQTPEELEAQLEQDELQLLVEKHAPKVRREAQRHSSRFQTDRRVLRGQSHFINCHDWLPTEILDSILCLAQAESNDSNRRQGQQSLLKVLTEEDAMAKLWTLNLTLRDLGFTEGHIQPVLRWLCANAASIDISANVWGLQDALEWLALNPREDYSFSYEDPPPGRPSVDTPDISRPATPSPEALANRIRTLDTSHLNTITTQASGVGTPGNSTPVDSDHSNNNVSDLDSDIDLDELVPAYLRIKSKLYEIDPKLVESDARRHPRNVKSKGTSPASHQTPTVRKLLSQLRQLASDALFDEHEAEAQWPAKRNQTAQDKATKRQQRDAQATLTEKYLDKPIVAPAQWNQKEIDPATDTADFTGSDDETDLLGDMFSAIPDDPATEMPLVESVNAGKVVLRDFGKTNGMTPRKLLEEIVRSRDPHARLICQMISPTAYFCRHSLTIIWSKDNEIEYDEDIDGVIFSKQRMKADFEVTTVATVTSEQSENYVSTAALFSISVSSPKEEKAYQRLSSNWKGLYKEFLEHRRTRIDAADRDVIKHYRSIIQDQIETEESDGVVLTNRFKMRNQAATSSSTSNSGYNTPVRQLEGLKEIWTQKASSPAYQHMLIGRANLPVFNFRDSILSTVDKNQVTIICGETGCGKSTQIPSFILEHELLQGRACKVFCTEPRRISAISLAQRVSEELGEGSKDLGTMRSLVGYAIRLESKTSQQTRLVYATVGVVLRMLESSLSLADVSHLILDEVHERSIDTDFLLIILRSLMERRPELKVILMSATVDAARFSQYLNGAPILTVPGRTFPVQTRFLEDAIELTHYAGDSKASNHVNTSDDDNDEIGTNKSGIPSKLPGYNASTRNALSNYDEYAIDYNLMVRLIESVAFDPQLSRFSSAILVFLPGIAEIRQLNDMLTGHPSFDSNWFIYPLHSTISSEDQQAAFVIPPFGIRKIVLATNIAETGVTIPDITCVIDTGRHKEMRFDERRQLSRLTQSFISRANAKQRRGRAGRVQEGLCFHLFTKYRHDNLMAEQQTPEMLRLSLQDLVMRTKICKLGDVETTLSHALDPPTFKNIRRAIDALIEVDALTPNEDLTPLGRQIAKLPLDAHLGKLVLLASTFACLDAAITIAAILSSKSPFLTPFGAKQRAGIARLTFKKGDSDLLTTYNAYRAWKRAISTTHGRSEMQFCHKNFLSPQNLGNIEDLKAQLLSSLVEAGFVHMSQDERRALYRYRNTSRHRTFVEVPAQYDVHSDNDVLVNSIIATAFYPKILTREGKGWRNITNSQTVSLAPTSVNKGSLTAKFLSYYHIMQSSNKFYNAHSTSIAYPIPMVLMVAADLDVKLHAGVISLPGNVLRFVVQDWRAAVALKVLRRRVKEILANRWRNPVRQLSEREKEWLDLFLKVFVDRFEKDQRIRERAGGNAK